MSIWNMIQKLWNPIKVKYLFALQYDTNFATPVMLCLIEDRKRATSGCRFLGHQTETLEHVPPCTAVLACESK
jgi:hypothetical protein